MKRLTIMALVLCLASPALAVVEKDKGSEQGKGKGKGKDKEKGKDKDTEKEKGRGERSDEAREVFANNDRETVRLYFGGKYGPGNCPPGLAKKNNGCLPPGLAKKRYEVGKSLPREVVYLEPPAELVVKLTPCPKGYQYVVVDGDLVKLAIGTMLVVDAIDGLMR